METKRIKVLGTKFYALIDNPKFSEEAIFLQLGNLNSGGDFIIGVDPKDSLRPTLFFRKKRSRVYKATGIITLDPKSTGYNVCSFAPYF